MKKKAAGIQEKKIPEQKSIVKFLLLALIVITLIIYFKSLNNKFTEWDDDKYVTQNLDIRTLHSDSIAYSLKKTFTSYVMGNYHPITMLTYSIEYQLFKLNPKPYHVTNLILHVFNTLLVFYFIWLLTKQRWTAFITALLFTIHPMHVESVAWVAERKDVLYSFFYLSALCTYLLYLQKENKTKLFYTLILFLFVLSLLSKGMAVSFTICLFIIDYFLGRKLTVKTFLEKLPFLLLSLLFGSIAIIAQHSFNTIHINNYNYFERILFSSYGLLLYLWKFIVPIKLSCYYGYPSSNEGIYPAVFYIAPFIVAGILFLVYRSKKNGKDILFGVGFFIVTILLVLQLLPVGGTIIAERYTYLPYIGLSFIIARLLNDILENKTEKIPSFKKNIIPIFIGIALLFCFLTLQRSKVWYDNITLFSDAIESFAENPLPFKARGETYYRKQQYDKAIADFNQAIHLKLDNYDIYYDRALAYYKLNKLPETINDYTTALKHTPTSTDALINRGIAYSHNAQYENAIADFDTYISLKKDNPTAYYDRGLCYSRLKKYIEAINDYNIAISYNPNYAEVYFSKGLAYNDMNKFEEAIKEYTSAISLKPEYAEAYYNRSGAYFMLQQYSLALADAAKAQQLGFSVDARFIQVIQTGLKK